MKMAARVSVSCMDYLTRHMLPDWSRGRNALHVILNEVEDGEMAAMGIWASMDRNMQGLESKFPAMYA